MDKNNTQDTQDTQKPTTGQMINYLLQKFAISLTLLFFMSTGLAFTLTYLMGVPFYFHYGVSMTVIILVSSFFAGAFGIEIK